MRDWSLALHGPSGILQTIDTGESEFVLGAETGPDVFSVTGEGVAARHAWVSIGGVGWQRFCLLRTRIWSGWSP